MNKTHWSKYYLNFIAIEITYSDLSVQTWDYDCIQYPSLEWLKTNMSEDFKDPRNDQDALSIYLLKNNVSYFKELEITGKKGDDFVDYIFENIEELLNGN